MRPSWHALRRDGFQDGTAAIELALLSPLLVIMLTGLIEIGMGAFESMQVQAAAEAGALYAVNNGTTDLEKIRLAVTSATGTLGITAPVPVVFCGCPVATGVTGQGSDCATLCADGRPPGKYVQVNALISRTELLSLPYLSLPLPASFTGKSVVRTQ